MIQRYSDEYTSGLHYDCNGRYVKYDDHEDELAACAAGPWRYDVENAPKDGSQILAYWHAPGQPEIKFTSVLAWGDGYWHGHGHYVIYNWIIAFAVLQVKP